MPGVWTGASCKVESVNRRLTKLLLFLLLGAIVNVAVAWGIWVYGDRPEMNPFGGWTVIGGQMWIEHGGTRMRPRRQVTTTFAPYAHGEYIATLSAFGIRFRDTVIYTSLASKSGFHSWSCVAECGWPLMCLTLRESKTRPGVGTDRQGALQIGGMVAPARPLWPGFAINTVFYAMITTMLWLLTLNPLPRAASFAVNAAAASSAATTCAGANIPAVRNAGWRR